MLTAQCSNKNKLKIKTIDFPSSCHQLSLHLKEWEPVFLFFNNKVYGQSVFKGHLSKLPGKHNCSQVYSDTSCLALSTTIGWIQVRFKSSSTLPNFALLPEERTRF